jgi:cobalt-zinc-cadmium efflux system outer membrane protein
MGLHRWPNPHAELGVRFGAESPTLDLGATLDLTEMLLLGYRVPEGKAELAAAQAESIQALLGVAHTAKRALFVQQANLAAATLEERVFQAIDAALETTRAMHEAGNATDLELARQEAAAAEASLRSLDAKAEVKAGDQQLRSILAVGQAQDSLRIAAELPALPPTEPSWVDAEQKALARNLQIEAAKQHEAAAEEAQSGAWVRGVLPRLGVGVGAEREDDNWSVGPMLELEVPLFYQGQAERAAAAARAA